MKIYSTQIKSLLWSETLAHWSPFSFPHLKDRKDILQQSVWYSHIIQAIPPD